MKSIENIDSRVFEKYIENKGEPLVGSIEQGMLLGEYRWEDDLPLMGKLWIFYFDEKEFVPYYRIAQKQLVISKAIS